MKKNIFVSLLILSLASVAAYASPVASTAKQKNPSSGGSSFDDKNARISATSVAKSLNALGLKSEKFIDKNGDPHFVIAGINGAKSVAIFMDDCKSGRCEDVTFYADFGSAEKITPEMLNEWNHIGSKVRSRASRSNGITNTTGSLSLSTTVSFVGDHEYKKLSMQFGLFMAEILLFANTIEKNK